MADQSKKLFPRDLIMTTERTDGSTSCCYSPDNSFMFDCSSFTLLELLHCCFPLWFGPSVSILWVRLCDQPLKQGYKQG
jgi:hypothetical protein